MLAICHLKFWAWDRSTFSSSKQKHFSNFCQGRKYGRWNMCSLLGFYHMDFLLAQTYLSEPKSIPWTQKHAYTLTCEQVVTFAVQIQSHHVQGVFSKLLQLANLQKDSALQVHGYDVLYLDGLEVLSEDNTCSATVFDWSPEHVSFWLARLGMSLEVCVSCCSTGCLLIYLLAENMHRCRRRHNAFYMPV